MKKLHPVSPVLALVLLGSAAAPSALGFQAAAPRTATLVVQARADDGQAIDQLLPEDVELAVAGQEVELLGVDRPSADRPGASGGERISPWQVTIYVDPLLLRHSARRELSQEVSNHTDTLLGFRGVEIVVAEPLPTVWLGSSRDPKLILSTLDRAGRARVPGSALHSHRVRFRHALRKLPRDASRQLAQSDELIDLVRAAARAEAEYLGLRLEALRRWLRTYPPSGGPRVLLWLTDGFELDLSDFYLEPIRGPARDQLEEEILELDFSERVEEVAQEAAASGWTVLATLPPPPRPRFTIFAALPAEPILGESRTGLEPFAVASNGRVLFPEDLQAVAQELHSRWLVSYEEPAGDGAALPIELVSRRPGIELRGPTVRDPMARRDQSQHSEALDKATFGRLQPEAVLPVACRAESVAESPILNCKIELQTLRERLDESDREMVERRLRDTEIALSVLGREGEAAWEREFAHTFSVAISPEDRDLVIQTGFPPRLAGREIAVALAERWLGLWGFAEVAQAPLPADFVASGDDVLRRRDHGNNRPLYLVPLRFVLAAGRIQVEARALAPEVEQVQFWLDGVAIATVEEPFETTMRLTDLPEPHMIEAVALGAKGERLGSDRMMINRGIGRFEVAIEEPELIPGPGSYPVTVEVSKSGDLTVESVELYWREELLTRFERPPYVAEIVVPDDREDGYLRAVATLEDGRQTEDIRLLSAQRVEYQEEIETDLVEMYAVVRDRRNRVVGDLEAEEMVLKENGTPQVIHTFEYAADVPLTLGLTIDISGSMRDIMPVVKEAARRFLEDVISVKDRSFLHVFAEGQFLMQPPTSEHDLIADDISSLPAQGGTALHDAVIFGLLQLRELGGRKALVILTDGDDQDSHFKLSQAREFARRSGIPVYVIRIDAEQESSDVKTPTRGLAGLARGTGGRMYVIGGAGQLGEIYGAIAEELRNQYVLSYHPDHASGQEGWREITLRAKRTGVTIRTISGYYARP